MKRIAKKVLFYIVEMIKIIDIFNVHIDIPHFKTKA